MPTVKVMADYHTFPLWSRDSGDNIGPDDLPISPGLRDALRAWAARYDATLNEEYPPDSGFASAEEEHAFTADGLALARRVAAELGPGYQVEYFDGSTSVPVAP